MDNYFTELYGVNVNGHTEKKNNLTYLSWAWAWGEIFQSTPSVGRATATNFFYFAVTQISIHALRGEGDVRTQRRKSVRGSDFNPRPPWGGRLYQRHNGHSDRNFNPRPPWGGRHKW